MRRISKQDCLVKNSSFPLRFSISTLLATLLLLLSAPATTFSQTDPFSETKPAARNPFADLTPAGNDNQIENESGNPDATSNSEDSSDEVPPEGSDLKGSDLKTSTEGNDSSTATNEGIPSAASLSSPIDKSELKDQQTPETALSGEPESTEDLLVTPARALNTFRSTDWISLLSDNWYWPAGAILLLSLLGWLFSRGGKSKKNLVQPRIKSGSFKKTTRFQKNGAQEKTPDSERDTGESASSDASGEKMDTGGSSQIANFEEESVSDASSDASALATEPNDVASPDENDDDFLDLMLDQTTENDATKLEENVDELDDFSLEDDDVDPTIESEALDDDFLDLMMDETAENGAAKLVDNVGELDDLAIGDDDVDPTIESETTDVDDDDFFDMVLEDDEASSVISADEAVESVQANEAEAPLFQSTESLDIGASVESEDSIALEDDSDEFSFDLEDDIPAETAAENVADEDLADKAEEITAFDVDEEPTPAGGITFAGADDVLIEVADDSDIADIDLNDDQSSVAGGVTAAAGLAAGLGALFATGDSTDSAQKIDDASVELREQLTEAYEKQQQNAAEIRAQKAEIEDLNAKLADESESAEQLDRLKSEVQDLKNDQLAANETNEALQQRAAELEEKLEAAEKNASEFESKLVTAEANFDALEEEKKKIAKEFEDKSSDSETVAKLEAEVTALKAQAEDAASIKEKLLSDADALREEVRELKDTNQQMAALAAEASESSVSAALTEDSTDADDSTDSSQFKQLKAQFEEELALRKQTEAMLVEAEQQRTDVAIALRDLRKQSKEQVSSEGSSEEIDTLKERLSESKSANESLEQQLDSFRKKLEQEHSVAKELTAKLELSHEKVSAVTVLEQQWKQKLETLESELETKEREGDRLTSELEVTKESLDKIEGAVSELQSNEEEHKVTLASYEANLLESQSKLESVIAEKSQMELSFNDLKEKAGALSYGQLEEALASVAKLSEERGELSLKLEQTRTAGEEAARQNAQLSERVAQLDKQLDSKSEIAEQLAEARKQLDDAKDRAIETDRKNNALQLQVDSLKQNLESLDRQRLSLKENLEARDREAADGEATINKETAKLIEKVAALEQSLSNSVGAEDVRLQLAEGKEQLQHAQEQKSVLAERVAGLEKQLNSRHADVEKLDSVQLQLASQTEQVAAAKEENATLKERVSQLNEQIKAARDLSEKLEQTVNELSQEKARLTEMSQTNAVNQQRIKLLEDQVRKSELAHMEKPDVGNAANATGVLDSERLDRILGQLESQNHQINQLVNENKSMVLELASREAAAGKRSSSSKAAKRTKSKAIPQGCDDLTEIVGVGPMSREKLYKAGVKTFGQIASWSKEDVEKYSKELGYKSTKRIEQEKWVSQANKLS